MRIPKHVLRDERGRKITPLAVVRPLEACDFPSRYRGKWVAAHRTAGGKIRIFSSGKEIGKVIRIARTKTTPSQFELVSVCDDNNAMIL